MKYIEDLYQIPFELNCLNFVAIIRQYESINFIEIQRLKKFVIIRNCMKE